MITDAQVATFTKAFNWRLNAGAQPGEDPARRWREATREGLAAVIYRQLPASIGVVVRSAPTE